MMRNNLINKIKNINYLPYIKLFFINLIKGSIAYLITKFILGYTLFKPILIRSINYSMENITFESIKSTDYLFLICAPKEPGVGAGATVNGFFKGLFHGSEALAQQEVFNGFTLSQIIIFGITYGVIYYTLGLTQEYLVPPVMRSMGWTNWYTDKERMNMIIDSNIVTIQNQQRMSENILTIINNQNVMLTRIIQDLNSFEDRLKNRLNFDFDTSGAMVNSLRNTILDLQRGVLSDIYVIVSRLEDQMSNINNLTTDLHARPIPNFHEELERINVLFNTFQSNLNTAFQGPLGELQTQIQALETFDPNDLHSVTDQLRTIMSSFVQQAQQISAETAVVGQAIQTQVERAEQIESTTNTIITTPRTNIRGVQPNGRPNPIAPDNLSTETFIGGLAAAREAAQSSNTRPNDVSIRDTNTVSVPEMQVEALGTGINRIGNIGGQGSYSITQEGDQLVLRLFNVKANFNIPIENMATNPMGTEIISQAKRAAGNFITDRVTSFAFNGLLRIGAGALGGGLTGMGFSTQITNAILRNISPAAVSDVGRAEEKIETGLQVAKTFGKAAINVLFK